MSEIALITCPPPRKCCNLNNICYNSDMEYHSRKLAFTLAEVLITLGIIGIVAALTLPSLIQNNQNKELQTALKKSYSAIQQAINQINADTGEELKPSYYYKNKNIVPLLKSYFNGAVLCHWEPSETYDYDIVCDDSTDFTEVSSGANTKLYTTFNKTNNHIPLRMTSDGGFLTRDGMLYLFNDVPGTTLYINVDVNGPNKKPNMWGKDLFTFQLMRDGKVLPMGAEGTIAYHHTQYCDKNSLDGEGINGYGCTNSALNYDDFWKNGIVKW